MPDLDPPAPAGKWESQWSLARLGLEPEERRKKSKSKSKSKPISSGATRSVAKSSSGLPRKKLRNQVALRPETQISQFAFPSVSRRSKSSERYYMRMCLGMQPRRSLGQMLVGVLYDSGYRIAAEAEAGDFRRATHTKGYNHFADSAADIDLRAAELVPTVDKPFTRL